jgi:hypothetical protein
MLQIAISVAGAGPSEPGRRRFGHRFPLEIAGIAPGELALVVDGEEVQPLVVEQRAHTGVLFEHRGHRFARGLDADRQAQRLVHQLASPSWTDCHGRPARSSAAVAFDHADAADHVVEQLVAAAEQLGRDARAVVSAG